MTVQTTTGEVYQPSQTSTLAVVSLVAGILGWTLFPILGCIVAIITGIIARNEIRDAGGSLTGGGFATAGLILGWGGLLLSFCGLCTLGICLPFSLCAALFVPTSGVDSSAIIQLAAFLI